MTKMYCNPLKRKSFSNNQGGNQSSNGAGSPAFKRPKTQVELQKIVDQRKSDTSVGSVVVAVERTN